MSEQKSESAENQPKQEKKQKTQNQKAQEKIAELGAQLKAAQSSGGGNMAERIAFLEGRLGEVQDQEKLYQERKARYLENVAKRKAKEDKKAAVLASIEDED